MSSARLRECLTLLGWSGQELANRIGKNEKQVRRWLSGEYVIPQHIADWVEKLAHFHEQNPFTP